jgi:hypothetical protein
LRSQQNQRAWLEEGACVVVTKVDFTNMFMRSFYARRSQECKKTVKSSMSFLALLGSAGAKVARKTFVKSALEVKKIFQSKKLSSIKVRKNQSQIIRRLQK